jgi:eukaryotic-like serine/threonine-protein kinase
MSLLSPRQRVTSLSTGIEYTVETLLGAGGQGEVYVVESEGKKWALKWYNVQFGTKSQREALERLISLGPPNNRFLWPLDLVTLPHGPQFGYIMPLREPRYRGLDDWMLRKIAPSFQTLATVGFELAENFSQLHSKGLCYKDINLSNIFFDPDKGDILILDNDNVRINRQYEGQEPGTIQFMAPELVRGQAKPSIETDVWSLAVLLFHIFMVHHPLEGRKEVQIRAFDAPAMKKLYGTEPVFIFHPHDTSNRPDPRYHGNALIFWNIYPRFLKDLFIQTFTSGIQDPHRRVRESQWRTAMVQLRDSLVVCNHCGAENFSDIDRSTLNLRGKTVCWKCRKDISHPPVLRLGKHLVILNRETRLYPYHVGDPSFDFSHPVAQVSRHPTDARLWGLRNLSGTTWVATKSDGTKVEIVPGQSVALYLGLVINFGLGEGTIQSIGP